MAIRIAVTLAGGVSLGAYQGGVAYELLWALSHRTDPGQPIFVDVITGSSAGSMTGALMARALLLDRTSTEDLYRAWVSGVSFDSLIAGRPSSSLLSDETIWRLARKLLEPVPIQLKPHPAVPPEMRIAFTLSNLNGINYALGYANIADRFDTTVFSDWVVFRTSGAVPPGGHAALWQRITRAAIASGAFPLAFPTVGVVRQLADYRGSEVYDPVGTREFAYVDGGLFNNEPVGLAREMVEEIEQTNPQTYNDERLYILVDPYVADTSGAAEFAHDSLGPLAVLGRLVGVILGEASKRDWIRAQRVNTRLRWQDELLEALAEVVSRIEPARAQELTSHTDALVEGVATAKVKHAAAGVDPSDEALQTYLDENMIRLGPLLSRDAPAYRVIEADSTKTQVLLNLAFLLENVAGLRKKTELKLHLIAPKRGSLAGDFLANFGGFFNQEWREHDWRRGRADAHDTIRRLAKEFPALDYEPDAPSSYVPSRDFSRVGEGDIPLEAFAAMKNRIKENVSSLLGINRAPWLKRIGLGWLSNYVANKVVARMKEGGRGVREDSPPTQLSGS